MILLDNSILARLTNSNDPDYRVTQRVVFRTRAADTLVITPQCLYEFWAVATRSRTHNGLGMDPERAQQWSTLFRRMFALLPDPVELLDVWQELVRKHQVAGFQCHDTRYVAAMQCHGIQELLTYNVAHFRRYPITVTDPHNVT
jgi:predicted nucleic acid-binding protein